MKLNAGRNLQESPCMYVLVGVNNCGFQSAPQTVCRRFLHACDSSSVQFEQRFWVRRNICLGQHLVHDSKWISEEECEHSKHASYFSRTLS